MLRLMQAKVKLQTPNQGSSAPDHSGRKLRHPRRKSEGGLEPERFLCTRTSSDPDNLCLRSYLTPEKVDQLSTQFSFSFFTHIHIHSF